MKVMLDEVDHTLEDCVDWNKNNHEQLVYCKEIKNIEGKEDIDYKWSILATNPDSKDKKWKDRVSTSKFQMCL